MKLLDSIIEYIRNIISHYIQKKLQAPKILNTDVIPITYDSKQREYMALSIKEEINRYKDFYRVFLSNYDGICIGNTTNDLKNQLVIDETKTTTIIQRPNPHPSKSKEHKKFEREQEIEFIKNRSVKLLELAISQTLKGDLDFNYMREYYDSNDIKASFENDRNERDFYRQLLNNHIKLPIFLYSSRDWKNLKLFLGLDNEKEFIEKYIDQHLFNTLNWAIELYNDKFYNNNIDIIYEALTLRKNTELKLIRGINLKMKKMRVTSLEFEVLQSYVKKYIREYVNMIDERFRPTKNFKKNKLNKSTIIGLVSQILIYIDPTRELIHFFIKKMKEGKINIFNENEKQRVIKDLTKMLGEDKDKIEKDINTPRYWIHSDICVIPIVNYITDIPTIIHEFIHQYYRNKKQEERYSAEIPSIFFEKVAMDYLIDNGFQDYESELKDKFSARIDDQYLENDKFLEIAKVTKKKKSKKRNKSNNDVPKSYTIEDIKKDIALLNRTFEEKKEEKEIISYALGTLFAKRYSKDKNVIERMLQFIKNPEYSLQNLIDDIQNEEKNKTIEEEIKNGQDSATSFPS